MRERSWIDVDETDRKMFASALRCVQRYLSRHGFSRGDSATVPIHDTAAIPKDTVTVATLRKKLKAYVDTVEPEKWSGTQVKGEVGRQDDLSTTMAIVKQRLEAAFEHLNADTTGRIENLYAHVRKIEKEYMDADDNEEYSNSEDDAASDMSDSDVESVEDQEDTSHSESSSSSDDVDSESDTDEM
eukprot:Em0817g1a